MPSHYASGHPLVRYPAPGTWYLGCTPTLRAMFKQIGAGEIILILAVLLLLFGAKKLPDLARSLGKSARELRKGLHEDDDTPDPDAK